MAQHRNKHAVLQAVTANRLADGEPVYFTDAGEWAVVFVRAARAEGADASAALLARAQAAGAEVIEPYLFEVQPDVAGLRPASMRERIRAAGPTTDPSLGKQAG